MKNIVITGFMGTGKSTVGPVVAAALGMTFVDMDDVIEERAGMPITEIFAREGEGAFRALESALARELGAREGMVIATGGGTILQEENRMALGANGLIVCLSCAVEEILRRVEGNTLRPLLAAPDKKERIEAILADRAAVYGSLPVLVDTTGRSVAEVAETIVESYRETIKEADHADISR